MTLVGEAGKGLARIAAQVGEISGIGAEISTFAKQQAVGLQEVNSSVTRWPE